MLSNVGHLTSLDLNLYFGLPATVHIVNLLFIIFTLTCNSAQINIVLSYLAGFQQTGCSKAKAT